MLIAGPREVKVGGGTGVVKHLSHWVPGGCSKRSITSGVGVSGALLAHHAYKHTIDITNPGGVFCRADLARELHSLIYCPEY